MAKRPEIEMTFNDFAEDGAAKARSASIFVTASKIHALAVSLAPVEHGQLRNSLMFNVDIAKDDKFNSQGGTPASNKITLQATDDEGYVGTALDYGFYQEFGTVRMKAQPYLRPAGEIVAGEGADDVIKKYNRDAMQAEFKIRKIIRKIFK